MSTEQKMNPHNGHIVVKGPTAMAMYREIFDKTPKEQVAYVTKLLEKKKKRNEVRGR